MDVIEYLRSKRRRYRRGLVADMVDIAGIIENSESPKDVIDGLLVKLTEDSFITVAVKESLKEGVMSYVMKRRGLR